MTRCAPFCASRHSVTLTAVEIARVELWLQVLGPRGKNADGSYGDAQMTDECVADLNLSSCNNHVYDLVREYIRLH